MKKEDEIIDFILSNLNITQRLKLPIIKEIRLIDNEFDSTKYNNLLDKLEFGFRLIQRKDYEKPKVSHYDAKLTPFGFDIISKYGNWSNYLENNKKIEEDRNNTKKLNKYSIYISLIATILTLTVLVIQTITTQKVFVENDEIMLQLQKENKELKVSLKEMRDNHHSNDSLKVVRENKTKNVN